jgi:hypothetical protein
MTVVGVVLLAGVVTAGLYLYTQSNSQTGSSETTEADEVERKLQESTANNQKAAQAYAEELTTSDASQISSIQSVDDLKKLDESEQGRVGVLIISDRINSDKTQEAQVFIEYVMNLPTGYGLEAARLCYATATDDSRKAECKTVIYTRAVEQGIIAEGETLPPSYFELPTGDPS